MSTYLTQPFMSRQYIVLRTMCCIFVLFICSASLSTASDKTSRLQDEAVIRKLSLCYAHGTDAIGRGDKEAGKTIYQPCFTKDAAFTATFPNGQSETRKGSMAWADFVDSVFKKAGYTSTQHLLGNISIQIHGETATMSTYLHATHVLSNGSIDIANGTYEDEVVKTQDGWQIKSRTLTLITFFNVVPSASQ